MKHLNLLKALGLAILTLVIMVGGFAISFVLMGAANVGASLAATGGGIINETVTTDGVDTVQPELNMDYVSQQVTKMRPASVPLDTLIRAGSKMVNVNSWETSFYAVDVKPIKDAVNGAYTNPGTAVTADIVVDNISIWNVDDTFFFPTVLGGNGQPLMGAITAKAVGTSTITIQVSNGTGGATAIVPNIADDSVIVRMSPAKSELDAQHSPFAIIPEKEFNYCQIRMAQIEASTYDKIQKKEVGWNFSDYEELTVYDMRAASELSHIFGQRKKITDATDSEVKYLAGGINQFITKGLEYAANGVITTGNFNSWSREMFEDNSGSDTRYMFAGDSLLESLSNVDIVQKQLAAKSTEVVYGVTFNTIETNWGKIYIKRHPLFRLCGWENNGLVLDMNNIERHVYKPLESKKLDLISSGQRNADATVLSETSCTVLRYPATHARITKAAA